VSAALSEAMSASWTWGSHIALFVGLTQIGQKRRGHRPLPQTCLNSENLKKKISPVYEK